MTSKSILHQNPSNSNSQPAERAPQPFVNFQNVRGAYACRACGGNVGIGIHAILNDGLDGQYLLCYECFSKGPGALAAGLRNLAAAVESMPPERWQTVTELTREDLIFRLEGILDPQKLLELDAAAIEQLGSLLLPQLPQWDEGPGEEIPF